MKYTHEFVKEYFDNEGYKLLSEEYFGKYENLDVICPEGHLFHPNFHNFKNGSRCFYCYHKKRGKEQRLSYEFIKEQFEKENYKLLSKEYKGNKKNLKTICPEGHEWKTTWNRFSNGARCRFCSYEQNIRNKTQKHSYEFVKEQFEKENYKLLSKEYINANSKLDVECSNGHKYETCFHWFLNGGNRCSICYVENNKGENHPRWRGGGEYVFYDVYANQIDWCEKTRRDPEDENILQVKCTYCGKWYAPTANEVKNRISSLNGDVGESRLYCSSECKKECPIYHKKKYSSEEFQSKNFNTSREVQAELRQMVFEIDNWECQRCGDTKSLHCHHIEGVEINPIESADIDNCITFCKKCHKWIHRQKGCTYQDFKRKECEDK